MTIYFVMQRYGKNRHIGAGIDGGNQTVYMFHANRNLRHQVTEFPITKIGLLAVNPANASRKKRECAYKWEFRWNANSANFANFLDAFFSWITVLCYKKHDESASSAQSASKK